VTVTLKIGLLAALQGLTEVFPISSAGHLVLAKHALQLESSGASLEIVLHAGTWLAVIVFYRRAILTLLRGCLARERTALRHAGFLVVGCVPAGAVGALFENRIERAFEQPALVAVMLAATGLFLLSVRWARSAARPLGFLRALAIGAAQAVAILPGVSRSGSTIGMARHLGVEPAQAAEFSFLMSVPLLAGAMGMKLLKAFSAAAPLDLPLPALAVGIAVAAVVGYAALAGLARVLTSGRFWWFGFYSLAVGGLSLLALS